MDFLIAYILHPLAVLGHALLQAVTELQPVPEVDPQIPDWLAAAFAVGGIYEVIKMILARYGFELKDRQAIYGSFVVGILVTLGRLQIGELAILPADITGVFPWLYAVLKVALESTVAANATYKWVYKSALKKAPELTDPIPIP